MQLQMYTICNDKTNAIQSGSDPAGHLKVIQPEMINKLSFSSASYDYDNKVIMVDPYKLATDQAIGTGWLYGRS